MPKDDNVPVCACGFMPKARNNSFVLLDYPARKLSVLLPKSKGSKSEGKGSRKQHDDGRESKNQTPSETGSSSSGPQTEPARPIMKSRKHEEKLYHLRRARSADRAATESHYTYIDSGSSILGGGIRGDTIPEALYATISETPNTSSANEISTTRSNSQNSQNRPQPLYSTIPSMTSPPPTYDVAIGEWQVTLQSGLPPTYEEYLRHKYSVMSRSHTPPPPWTDTTSSSSSKPSSSVQAARRDFLASQLELREYLAQLKHNNDRGSHHQHQQQRQQPRDTLREQQVRQQVRELQARAQQRARAMHIRSRSEHREQKRMATCEDAAFCMETTVLQSALDSGHGFALCSLM